MSKVLQVFIFLWLVPTLSWSQQIIKDFEDDIFAIIVANKPIDSPWHIRIAGSAFQINDSVIVSANHVISTKANYEKQVYWLVSRNSREILRIDTSAIKRIPNKDICFIPTSRKLNYSSNTDTSLPNPGDALYAFGYHANNREQNVFKIKSFFNGKAIILKDYYIEPSEQIFSTVLLKRDTQSFSNDKLKLQDAWVLILDGQSYGGLSGGPIISSKGIVGMASYYFTNNKNVKISGAISILQILDEYKKLKI